MTLADPRSDARTLVVCTIDQLDIERGAAALVDGAQLALFRLADDTVHAIDNRDPATGANVLARGLLGTVADDDGAPEWYVASPLHKHRFSLRDGRCLQDPSLSVTVHPVTVIGREVHVTRTSCSSS